MQEPRIEELSIQVQLKSKRNALFEEFVRNPWNTCLAVEIRIIDDRIEQLTRNLAAVQKSGWD